MTKRKYCTNCKHCGWEPDSDIYCGHPVAFEKISNYGASPVAMARAGLCLSDETGGLNLWKKR